MTVAMAIGSLAPDASLLVAIPVKRALYAAMRCRHDPAKALNQRFLQCWRLALPNLLELLTVRCSIREAWSYVERLLGQEPSFVALRALDGRIAPPSRRRNALATSPGLAAPRTLS